MTLLIVDDDEGITSLLNYRIKEYYPDMKFKVYESPKKLIEELKVSYPNKGEILLVSDINMWEMNGEELAKYLQSSYPEITISFLTAYEEGEEIEKLRSLGINKFFIKKVKLQTIVHQIVEYYIYVKQQKELKEMFEEK